MAILAAASDDAGARPARHCGDGGSTGNHALSPQVIEEIAERTGGVPLFVDELTKAMRKSGTPGGAALSFRAAADPVGARDLARLAGGVFG